MALGSFFFFFPTREKNVLTFNISQDGIGFAAGTNNCEISGVLTQQKCVSHSFYVTFGMQDSSAQHGHGET